MWCKTNYFVPTDKNILTAQTLNINRTDIHSFPITRLDFREWDKHTTMPSDTNDTSEECRVPGVGKYTHGDYNLTHQHWVQQIVNSGYFGMHDTESAEAFHKKCMRLPSERVRHLGPRRTQEAMLRYLMKDLVFTELKDIVLPTSDTRAQMANAGLHLPLRCVLGQRECNLVMGRALDSVATQQSVLHQELRLTRVEILDLLCAKFKMSRTTNSYALLEVLGWSFGQKLIMAGGATYWATDSAYTWYTDSDVRARRDCFILEGTETTTATLSGGRQERRKTALCCQAICFVKLTNVDSLRGRVHIPYDIECEIKGMSFIALSV
jgi:hypothetical protein